MLEVHGRDHGWDLVIKGKLKLASAGIGKSAWVQVELPKMDQKCIKELNKIGLPVGVFSDGTVQINSVYSFSYSFGYITVKTPIPNGETQKVAILIHKRGYK
jgi:hypothetical protein